MKNSLVTHLSGYVEALFKDIAYTYVKPSEARRDQSRLLHELGAQGVELLTLGFPAALKHFDKCLDLGLYTPSHLFLMGTSGECRLPVFLRDLHLQIFDAGGKLRECPSIDAVVAIRQVLGGVKKLKLQCSDRRTRNAVMDFISIEHDLRTPSLSWDGDFLTSSDVSRGSYSFEDIGEANETRLDEELGLGLVERPLPVLRKAQRSLQSVCDIVAAWLGDLSCERSEELPKHGPGVVAEQRNNRSKFEFRCWPHKLDTVFPYDWYGSYDLMANHNPECDGYPLNRELPSRMIAVPKTQKAPRLIAAEPVEHMWIQQLVRSQLEGRVRESPISRSIHFRDQTENQRFARLGSKSRYYATVDLSSASDRLSCWTVERAFRRNKSLLERLHACRTRWVRNGLYPELGEFIKLKKFANQGSACTFPVQTIIYTCVAIAAVLITKNEKVTIASVEKTARQVRVFGDDIILPRDSLDVLQQLLTFLGLKVNTDKTYSEGNFRESCGGDYFMGYDVSVAYLSHCEPLSRNHRNLLGSYVEVSNNFFQKGLWNIAKWLESLMPRYASSVPTVLVGSGAFGLTSYTGFNCNHLKKRWNRRIHAWEYRGYVPKLTTRYRETEGTYRLFKWFIEEPRELRYFDSRTVGSNESYWTLGWKPIHFYTDRFGAMLVGE